VLVRPLPSAALALAGVLLGASGLPAPLWAAPSLQALQSALNDPAPQALSAVLEAGAGLDPTLIEQRRALLRQRFPDALWQVQAGAPLRDGRPTTEVLVSGSRKEGPIRFRLEARQQLVLSGSGARFNRQEVIRESSILRSGDVDLKVSLLIPDAVLTGQRYDLDVVFDDPLEGAVVAGAIKPVSAAELLSLQSPDLPLEALGGGGLFKRVQAPYQPGTQTWGVLLVHPRGVVAASKQVRVVADRADLQL
jgi:hypothetical protein